jgi:hypothetical protein
MPQSDTAKPATALHGEPASHFERLGGELEIENTLSDNISQPETALAAAFRKAAARQKIAGRAT